MRIISPESARIFKDSNGVRKIDAMLLEVGAGFIGIPLEPH
jgi:hypothetical protein